MRRKQGYASKRRKGRDEKPTPIKKADSLKYHKDKRGSEK